MDINSWEFALTAAGAVATVVGSVFYTGFTFNKKIKEACAEQNTELEDDMIELKKRIEKLENEYINKQTYEKDMNDVKECIRDMHSDVKSSITMLSTRIDNVLLNKIP